MGMPFMRAAKLSHQDLVMMSPHLIGFGTVLIDEYEGNFLQFPFKKAQRCGGRPPKHRNILYRNMPPAGINLPIIPNRKVHPKHLGKLHVVNKYATLAQENRAVVPVNVANHCLFLERNFEQRHQRILIVRYKERILDVARVSAGTYLTIAPAPIALLTA
jgi:hypothetical protein